MMLSEAVFTQALMLAGSLEERQTQLLRLLCSACCASLEARLREGLKVQDCREEFVMAASLFALAALGNASQEGMQLEEFKAGDLTLKQSGTGRDAASRCLERQAEQVIGPYLADRFAFVGV